MQLANSVVIVTGAGSGIGRAIALELGRHKARVVCAGRRADRLEQTVDEIVSAGGEALPITADIVDDASAKALIDRTIATFGRVDVLMNNAGSFQTIGAVWEIDPDQWWHDVAVNLRGTMLCCHHAIPHMIRQGSGIVINMRGGDRIAGGTGYSCAKVAVERFTELLARELEMKQTNVLCFSVGPGFVLTEMTDPQVTTDAGRFWLPGANKAVETGRNRSPEDCARVVAALIEHADPVIHGKGFGPDSDIAAAVAEARREA
jgi:NAD(P)-dependent dehydrogenase (short-subunit alcohol dehydrogenase family)